MITGLDCGSCHQSPPPAHYPGPCSACHAEASDDGTSLRAGPLHANGTVDLGDGTGGCGACHGNGDDPTPSSGAHPAHAHPAIAAPFACAECHRVPTDVRSPGHLDATLGAEVTFGALASARGAVPQYAAGSCREVACHGAGLTGGTRTAPPWLAGDPAGACGACHGIPPPAPHSPSVDCGASLCHGGAIAPGPSFTDLGRNAHVDGTVQP
jgi:predicted CxxxxCH...CXXCH cytochrome family protein